MTLRDRLARKPPGYEFTIGRILAIYSGLMVALLLAALDQTIVATALPKVVSDLGGIGQYTWVFTAYMLGSTVTVPLYGKLGDVPGRKPLLVAAIVSFLVGSSLSGPRRPFNEEPSIDWLGAGVLAAGTTALLLGLVWGGNQYPWSSPEVIVALTSAGVLLALFAVVEWRVVEPILPFDLLRSGTVAG